MLTKDLQKILTKRVQETGLRELARQMDMHPSTLSRIVSGERLPTGAQFDQLGEFLRLKIVRKR